MRGCRGESFERGPASKYPCSSLTGGQCGQCKHDDRDRCEGGVAELRSPRGILTRRLEVLGLRAIPVSFSFLLFKISVAIDKIAVDSRLSLVGRNF